MPKFKFRLQSVLGIKEKVEDLKRNEFGKAVSQLALEQKKKADMEDAKTANIASLKNSIETGISPEDIRQHNVYTDMLKRAIKQQEQVIIRAEAYVEEKREELVEAMRDRKTLETLKDNDYEEYLAEEKKAEGKVVDEIVSYRGGTKRS